jgi:hypothetical protein
MRKKGKKKKPFNDNSLSKLEMGIWKKQQQKKQKHNNNNKTTTTTTTKFSSQGPNTAIVPHFCCKHNTTQHNTTQETNNRETEVWEPASKGTTR